MGSTYERTSLSLVFIQNKFYESCFAFLANCYFTSARLRVCYIRRKDWLFICVYFGSSEDRSKVLYFHTSAWKICTVYPLRAEWAELRWREILLRYNVNKHCGTSSTAWSLVQMHWRVLPWFFNAQNTRGICPLICAKWTAHEVIKLIKVIQLIKKSRMRRRHSASEEFKRKKERGREKSLDKISFGYCWLWKNIRQNEAW